MEKIPEKQTKQQMNKLITITTALLISGAVYGGCGTKIPVEGKLSEYDAEKKILKVGRQSITLAARADIKGADGSRAKIEDLIGQEILVSTDKHTKQGESVSVVGSEEKAAPKEKPKMKSNLLAESQDWTNSDGKTITAAVLKVEGGKVHFVINGKTVPYDVPKLSEETIGRLRTIMAEAKE